MDKIVFKIFAIVTILMLLTPLLAFSGDGENYEEIGGSIKCSTNLQLIPQSNQIGGGRITWTIEGQAAREFRRLLIKSVGNDEFFDEADGGDTLSEKELEEFLYTSNMLEAYIQRGNALRDFEGKVDFEGFHPVYNIDPDDHISYFGAEITRSTLSTNNITEDTKGLVGTSVDDSFPITIDFTMGFDESPGKGGPYDISMSDSELLRSVWESLIIPVRNELDLNNAEPNGGKYTFDDIIDHENLLSNETGDSGRYGIILRNDTMMCSNKYSICPDDKKVTIDENSIHPNDNISLVYAYSPTWVSDSEIRHWSYLVGTNNFYDPNYEDSLYLIRTPAGEILYYTNRFSADDVPDESITWVEFEPLMNPQILFIIIAVFSYFILKMPKKYYKDYQSGFPQKYQDRAEKASFIHLICKLFVIVLLILYFFPVIGPLFVNGIYLIVLAPSLMIVSVILSNKVYAQLKEEISDEIKYPPIMKPNKNAEEIQNKDLKKLKCDRCGEIFTIPKRKNLLTVTCPVCRDRQRKLKIGYNYLFLDDLGDATYSIYNYFIKNDHNGLIITTRSPSRIKEKHDLFDQEIKWISVSSSDDYDVLNPKLIESDIKSTISTFSENNDRSILLLEGLEYLLIENNFEKISTFIKNVTDITSKNDVTLLVNIDSETFSNNEMTFLKKCFDGFEDLRYKEK